MVICSGLHSRKWCNRNANPGFAEPRAIQNLKAHSFLPVDMWTCAWRVQATALLWGLVSPSKERQGRRDRDTASFVWLHFKQRQQHGN